MKLREVKGSRYASEAGFCCLRRRPDETDQGQRQQTRLKKQDFAASAINPMNPKNTIALFFLPVNGTAGAMMNQVK